MSGLERTIAELAMPAVLVTVLLLPLFGFFRVTSQTMREQPMRAVAVSLSLAVGAVGGGLVCLLFFGLATMDTGPRPEVVGAVIPIGLIVALVVAGISLGGYAILTLGGPGRRWALVGCVLAPVLVAGAFPGAVGLQQRLETARYEEEQAQERTRADPELSVSIVDVRATYAAYEGEPSAIETLDVTVTIKPTIDMQLGPSAIVWPRFNLTDPRGAMVSTDAAPGSPVVLLAGTATTYRLHFEPLAEGSVMYVVGPPIAGQWWAKVTLEDAGDRDYVTNVQFVVPAEGEAAQG